MKKLKFGSSLISNSKIPSTIAIKTLRTIPEPISLLKLNFFKNEIIFPVSSDFILEGFSYCLIIFFNDFVLITFMNFFCFIFRINFFT